tara:strand:- start:4715 stop:5182 length:468 start_codon:yes stop_codon:yes gene_type:complete
MNYITQKGYLSLKQEMQDLLQKERPKLVETIAWAASNGDRSENGDYIYGKKRLREIDRRIHYLKKRIEDAEVVQPETARQDRVVFSATVTVEDEEGEKSYMIVGEDEIDPENGRISWKSPIAKALIGKKLGDIALVRLPAGEKELEITKIEFKSY